MELPVVRRLKKDLEELRYELNSVLPKQLEEAREHGDLKENAEYHAAKERQGILNARIGQLEEQIRELSLVNLEQIPRDAIGYGSVVTLEDADDGSEVRYELVFPVEVDPAAGQISLSSPLGRALLHKCEGDELEVRTPRGQKTYCVLSVATIHDRNDARKPKG